MLWFVVNIMMVVVIQMCHSDLCAITLGLVDQSF